MHLVPETCLCVVCNVFIHTLKGKSKKHLEAGLVDDGYSRDSLLTTRHEIGGFIFYPNGQSFGEDSWREASEADCCVSTHFLELFKTHSSILNIKYLNETIDVFVMNPHCVV